MDIVKLKHKIIDKIQATESTEMLEEIHLFLNSQESNEANIYPLNEEQQNAIAGAREDIQKGRFSTDEEINADFKQLLKK